MAQTPRAMQVENVILTEQGHQAWQQILIRAARADKWEPEQPGSGNRLAQLLGEMTQGSRRNSLNRCPGHSPRASPEQDTNTSREAAEKPPKNLQMPPAFMRERVASDAAEATMFDAAQSQNQKSHGSPIVCHESKTAYNSTQPYMLSQVISSPDSNSTQPQMLSQVISR